jgi:hypothetical protein
VTALGDDVRLACSTEVLWRVLDGEAVLLDLASGTYFGLNVVGSRVWELLSAGKSLGEVRAALLDEFEVDAGVLEQDLRELLEMLQSRGLVKTAS